MILDELDRYIKEIDNSENKSLDLSEEENIETILRDLLSNKKNDSLDKVRKYLEDGGIL